jgi:hypothetical protein
MSGPPAHAIAARTPPAAAPPRPSTPASEAGAGALGSVALVLLWAAALFGIPALVGAAAAMLGAASATALQLAALALAGTIVVLLRLAGSRGARSLAL